MVGESNDAEVWGRSSQPPDANGGSGPESLMLRQFFTVFSKKYTHF